jgi:hypothetical protein
MPRREINPIPEMIKGQKWEVREAEHKDQAYVDLDKRQMVVPLDDSARSELLRSHELMHVAISPFAESFVMDAAVEDRTLQSVEDCRIWGELKRVGIDPSKVDIAGNERGRYHLIEMGMKMKGADKEQIGLEFTRLALARRNTGSEHWVREEIKDLGYEKSLKVADEVVDKFFKPYEGEAMPFQPVIDACEYIHHAFAEAEAIPEEKQYEGEDREGEPQDGDGKPSTKKVKATPKPGEGGKKKNKVSIQPVKPEGEEVKKLPRMSNKEKQEAEEAQIIDHFGGEDASESGTMEILRPQLTKRFKPSKGRKKVSADAGVNLKRLDRALTDQKIFVEKAIRDYGAAIIVDCSGSMHVTDEQIEMILDACPASTIALYASAGYSTNSGCLKVIVENKMRLDSKVERLKKGLGGGNVVDRPAVEWLAKRKEQRKIWVCDGYVTGRGDWILKPEEVRRITRLVLDGNIKRVQSIDELLRRKRTLLGI